VRRWTGDQRYTAPTLDRQQDMHNASVSYEAGSLTLTFQRARNTSDDRDWTFTDRDCFYFIFPVGGGPVHAAAVMKHAVTPVVSTEKICISRPT